MLRKLSQLSQGGFIEITEKTEQTETSWDHWNYWDENTEKTEQGWDQKLSRLFSSWSRFLVVAGKEFPEIVTFPGLVLRGDGGVKMS